MRLSAITSTRVHRFGKDVTRTLAWLEEQLVKSKPIPGSRGESANYRLGKFREDSLPVFVHSHVLDVILDDSSFGQHLERGGFLVGNVYEDAKTYLEINAFIPAIETRSRLTSLLFTHDTWAYLNDTMQRDYPNQVVVGWHHTHPGFGVFLSGHDLFIHRHFFSEPWQVALVVDPRKQEFCFFQWLEGKVVDCGFICVKKNKS